MITTTMAPKEIKIIFLTNSNSNAVVHIPVHCDEKSRA